MCRAGQSTKERKIFRHWSLRRRRSTRISQSFYEDMQDELNAEISRYVSLFTAGAYDSVRLDEQGQLQILTEEGEVRPELLSCGTLEQIYLALRLAVGKVVTKEETLQSYWMKRLPCMMTIVWRRPCRHFRPYKTRYSFLPARNAKWKC